MEPTALYGCRRAQERCSSELSSLLMPARCDSQTWIASSCPHQTQSLEALAQQCSYVYWPEDAFSVVPPRSKSCKDPNSCYPATELSAPTSATHSAPSGCSMHVGQCWECSNCSHCCGAKDMRSLKATPPLPKHAAYAASTLAARRPNALPASPGAA